MPLTPFQREVLAAIVSNRSEASHFAGGLVLNVADDSSRFSKDFDMFHDAVADLATHSDRDVATLREAGFEVTLLERSDEWRGPASFRQALVARAGDQVTIDWAHDSAWRFFPIDAEVCKNRTGHLGRNQGPQSGSRRHENGMDRDLRPGRGRDDSLGRHGTRHADRGELRR